MTDTHGDAIDQSDPRARELSTRIEIARDRRDRARKERRSNLWTMVARVGTVGWLVALPIVGGALLGHLIDRRFGTGVTWALALMMVGVAIGGYALWRLWREV